MKQCPYKFSCHARDVDVGACPEAMRNERHVNCPAYINKIAENTGEEQIYDAHVREAQSHLVDMTDRTKGRTLPPGWRA